ncbi:cupin domain-containing protein [Roseovarius sp.]|uniref:cupin domain-containing protein n=1 Tax=Roseovarius sp. TaxID=1486281 RepID=UPI003A9820CF
MKTIAAASALTLMLSTAALAEGVEKPTETFGVSVDASAGFPLAEQVPVADGYALRLRRVVLEPGAVIAHHSHVSRPSFAYVISGELVEHRDDGVIKTYGPGEFFAEGASLAHWAENKQKAEQTVLIGVDVVPE